MVFERLACDTVDASILGEPLKFNCGVTASNRFMKAALSEHYATYNKDEPQKTGIPTETLINMYEKWGNGGFGILLTGNVMIDTKNLEGAGNVIACRENASAELAEQLKRYAAACKMDGALAVAQVGHAGRQTSALVNPTPFSASDVQLEHAVFGGKYGQPVPLSTEQVKTEVVDRFAFAAKYLADAGFDGVQLHGAHGYLLSQFISPRTNKRTDKYGGSAENRARIVREVYEAIRAVVPPSFVVGIKLNSVEYQDDGMHIEDAKVVCQTIEECGFDFVEMSGGTYEKFEFAHVRDSTKKREAFFLEFTDQLRSLFKRTVFYVTGGFRTVKGMVSAVESGSTQGIGLGRPITAEPDLCKKILSGEVDSSSDCKFDPSDFMFSSAAAGCQMGQAGLRPFKDVNGDVCANITDFSIQENVDRFTTEALPAHFAVVMENTKQGKPTLGSIPFDTAKL